LGVAPDNEIAKSINLEKMHLDDPDNNVYNIPHFLKNRVLSNEMAKIIVLLLHYDPEHRYQSLALVKDDLLKLRKSIFETPVLMR
jgi:serine/threonine protein kinase